MSDHDDSREQVEKVMRAVKEFAEIDIPWLLGIVSVGISKARIVAEGSETTVLEDEMEKVMQWARDVVASAQVLNAVIRGQINDIYVNGKVSCGPDVSK
jgi:hypothetical protein